MSEAMPGLKPGDKIAKYTILGTLGSGALAVVCLAEQRLIKRKVAIKLFTIRDEDLLAMARDAMKSLAAMDHPHIIKLYDADEYGETFYCVMEYIQGNTLLDMIESHNELPITVVLKLMTSVADALDYARSLGIIHGDVKPANILVSSDGSPVLTDFSYPRVVEQDVFPGMVAHMLATMPPYMAPEGWRFVPDARSDLWAFGMTLYETLTGHLPFDVADEQGMQKAITSQAPYELLTGKIPHEADSTTSRPFAIALEEPEPITKHRSDLPLPLVAFLDQMLAHEPGGRFQSAQLAYEGLLAGVGLHQSDLSIIHSEMYTELRTILSQ